MRYLDRKIDDTTKYDFKVSPYKYCFLKHNFSIVFRFGKGLSRINPLSISYRLRRTVHFEDVRGVIELAFYRYLNDLPIKFKDVSRKHRTYWEEIKKGRDYNEVYYELWGKNKTPDSILKKQYHNLFYTGRKVRGSYGAHKQIGDNRFTGEPIYYVGEVIDILNDTLTITVIKSEQMKEGYSFNENFGYKYAEVGDTIQIDLCDVYLIPDE